MYTDRHLDINSFVPFLAKKLHGQLFTFFTLYIRGADLIICGLLEPR